MKKQFLIALLSAIGTLGWAQTRHFEGLVVDTTGTPLDMVSVSVLNPTDSTLEAFTVTQPDGKFRVESLRNGTYLLQVYFLGYSTHQETVKVGPGGTPADRGRITLVPQMNVLSEVVISGQRIPVIINKDTVEYDASAFRVRPEDNVEDLLKRLPGIEVDRDGAITAQGQEVEQVLVDGKEFFGGDPTVATRNIPADAVKNVQVYDRQSDDAKFTGVDDGERSKTINLELKEDRKSGYFGYAEAGGGSQERFMGKAGIHSFTGTTRLSVLANVNNVNDYGFSFGDYRDMSGGGMGRGGYSITINGESAYPFSFGGPEDGLYLSGASGVNFNWDPNSRHRFNASYFYTHLDNFINTVENSEQFVNDENITGYLESNSYSINNRHAFSINHRSDLDSMNRIEFTGSAQYNNGINGSETYETQRIGVNLLQESNRTTEGDLTSLNANFNLNYIHRFNTSGRLIKVGGGIGLNERDENGRWENYNNFPISGQLDSLNQNREDLSGTQSWNASAVYTEPLADNHFVEMRVGVTNSTENLLRNTYDAFSGGFQSAYSPDFDLLESSQSGRLSYRFTGEKHNLDVGLAGQRYTQQAFENRLQSEIPERSYFYFLPSVDYNWSISSFSRFSFNYSANVGLPSLTQLVTLQDITNPLVKYVGNEDLEPQYTQNVWVNYGKWNSFNNSGFFSYISAARVDNVISTSQSIDSNYVRTFTPENFDQATWRINASVNYRFGIDLIGMNLRMRANGGYNNSPNRINGELNTTENTNVGGSLGLETFRNDFWNLNFGGELTYNWSSYSLQERLNQEYLNHSYYANLEWTPTKQLGMETGVNLQTYSSASFAEDQFVPLWNANIRYNFLKDGTAQLKLTVFDILNQNRGVSRFANLNSIVERQTNSLGRYFMLSFLYKFNSVAGSGDRGGREEVIIRH